MRHTGGLLRRASMVVQSEANGLEARFWITSGLPTTHPESSMFSNVHADLLGYLVSPAAEWMICASVRIDGGEIKSI
jgi:hypothetical protein